MPEKNRDRKNRWRSKTVAFRVSLGEWERIETLVALSGSTKQDYLSKRVLERDVVVNGSPRVAKALKDEFVNVLHELKRIENGADIDIDLMDTIQSISTIIDGLNNNEQIKRYSFK